MGIGGFFGILTLVFITLKLTAVITWSWWLVLLPVYGGFVVIAGLMLLFLIFNMFSRQ